MKDKAGRRVLFHSLLMLTQSIPRFSWFLLSSTLITVIIGSSYIPAGYCSSISSTSPSSSSSHFDFSDFPASRHERETETSWISKLELKLKLRSLVKRQHVFDLSDFGAVGDGITDNTRVFQNALYAVSGVADKGGGQLYIPPGRFVTGSFNLTSNMTLYLARDAVILGSLSTTKWPVIAPLPSYGRGRERQGPRHSSLLYGQHLEDVVITGENGTIDGQGLLWWNMALNETLKYTRGSLIEVLWTKGLVLANITLINSPFWTFHPTYCREVLITNVTIFAPDDSPNVDGIDPDSCSDVLIEDVYISTGSDAISIKSGWDQYGISFNMPSSNIWIRNIVARSAVSAGFAIGSEMSGGVDAITLVDALIFESRVGILIKTSQGRGGYISGVNISNVTLKNVSTAIKFLTNIDQHPDPGYDVDAWPVVQGLSIKDIQGTGIWRAGELDGFAKSPFANIVLSNVTLKLRPGGFGFECTYVAGSSEDVTPEPCPQLKQKNASALLHHISRDQSLDGKFM